MPRANSSTSMTRPRESCWPPSVTTAPSRSTSGSGSEITIRELINLIVEVTGFRGEVRWDPSKPDGQPRRALDTTRSREAFGFTATTDFDAGIRRTVAGTSPRCPPCREAEQPLDEGRTPTVDRPVATRRVVRGALTYAAAAVLQRASRLLLLPFRAGTGPRGVRSGRGHPHAGCSLGTLVSLGLETAVFAATCGGRRPTVQAQFVNTLGWFGVLVPGCWRWRFPR